LSLDDDEIDHTDRLRACAASGATTGSDERHEASQIHQSEVEQGRLRTDEAKVQLPSSLTLETREGVRNAAAAAAAAASSSRLSQSTYDPLDAAAAAACRKDEGAARNMRHVRASGAAAQLRQNMNRLNVNSSYRAVIMTPRPASVIINTRRDKAAQGDDEIQEEIEMHGPEMHGPDVPSGPILHSSR
jgi:hypothetical protein